MVSRTLVQIFILAYAPRLLWASTDAAAEGAQMRNKHAPPSSKKKHQKHGKHGDHTQTFVQAHKHTVEVDHHGSAKKLPHKKAVRTAHSNHVQGKASSHAAGFAEVALGSKNVDGIHARGETHHVGEHVGQHVGDGGGHGLGCQATNKDVYDRQGSLWEEKDYAKDDTDLQYWLTNYKIEVDGVDAYEGFAKLQTLTQCAALCEGHTGATVFSHPDGLGAHQHHTHHTPDTSTVGTSMAEAHHSSSVKRTKNDGGKRCVAIAHSGVEGGDGYCRLFNDRLWTLALKAYIEHERDDGSIDIKPTPLEASEDGIAACPHWKAFVYKEDPAPPKPAEVTLAVEQLKDATKHTEHTANTQSKVMSEIVEKVESLKKRLDGVDGNNAVTQEAVTQEAKAQESVTQEAVAEEVHEAEVQEAESKQS